MHSALERAVWAVQNGEDLPHETQEMAFFLRKRSCVSLSLQGFPVLLWHTSGSAFHLPTSNDTH
jgi:hypothetical protein